MTGPDALLDFCSASVAGAVVKVLVAPLERATVPIFTCAKAAQLGVLEVVRKVYRHEGLRGFFKGAGLDVMRGGAARGATVGLADGVAFALGAPDPVAGAIVGFGQTLVFYPLDVVQTVRRASVGPETSSSAACSSTACSSTAGGSASSGIAKRAPHALAPAPSAPSVPSASSALPAPFVPSTPSMGAAAVMVPRSVSAAQAHAAQGTFPMLRSIWASGGLRGLYPALMPSLAGITAFYALQLGTRRPLQEHTGSAFAGGFLSTVMACGLLQWNNVVRLTMQRRAVAGEQPRWLQTLLAELKVGGVPRLYAGFGTKVLQAGISMGATVALYEWLRGCRGGSGGAA